MLHADGVNREPLVAAHAGGQGEDFGIAVIGCVRGVPQVPQGLPDGIRPMKNREQGPP